MFLTICMATHVKLVQAIHSIAWGLSAIKSFSLYPYFDYRRTYCMGTVCFIPQVADACTGYPVTHYNLNIASSSDVNQSKMILGPYISNGASRIEIMLNSTDGISQNAHYHFRILAVNMIGRSISSGMEFCKSWIAVTFC